MPSLIEALETRQAEEQVLAAPSSPVPGVDGAGGEMLAAGSPQRGRRRALATVFAKVAVTRIAYCGTGGPDLRPADAVLNLPRGFLAVCKDPDGEGPSSCVA